MAENELREVLAEYAHQAWSGWMDYMFAHSVATGGDGSEMIPAYLVDRWERQAATVYADLPEDEKKSDRAEADKILAIVAEMEKA